jgi:hypothetical protein
VSVGSGVLVTVGQGVKVGRRVLTGAGVSEGALARKLGRPQPRTATLKINKINSSDFRFTRQKPLLKWYSGQFPWHDSLNAKAFYTIIDDTSERVKRAEGDCLQFSERFTLE